MVIKFNCHGLLLDIFQLTKMLLARIFKQHSLLRFLPAYPLSAEAELRKPSPIHHKIAETQSWKDFSQLFASNQASFSAESLAQNSKHIITLFSRERENVNFGDLREMTRFIQTQDLSTFSERSVVGVLAIFRSFRNRGFDIHNKLRSQLCMRYVQALTARGESKEDSNELAMAYFEMSHAQNTSACRVISERLLGRVNRQPDNRNIFASVQSIFLLHSLSIKGELMQQERRLRTYLLGCLAEKVELLKLADVVKVVSYVNRMDIIDMENTDFQHLKVFTQRILNNITDLEEHSIFQFLRDKSAGRHPLIGKIYEEFVKNIFAEIEESGATQMDHNTVLKMLALLSFNFEFRRLTEIERKKQLSFLQVLAQSLEEERDAAKIRFFYVRVEDMIKNDFFDRSKLKEYSALFNINGQVPQVSSLETLFEKRLDCEHILQQLLSSPPKFSQELQVFRYALLVTRISRAERYAGLKEQLEPFLQSLGKRVEESFENPEKFVSVFREVLRSADKLDLRPFHDIYHEFFQRLPNPFEGAETDSTFPYRLNYFNYVLHGFKFKQLNEFLLKFDGAIKPELVHKVIQNHVFLQQDNRLVQPSRMVVNLAQRRLGEALEGKHKGQLEATLLLMQRYCRFVIMGTLDSHVTQHVFRILHTLVGKVELLNELGLHNLLQNVVEKYISRNYKNYSNEANYRDLLKHLLKKMSHFRNYTNVVMLQHGLRLNLITKEVLQGVDLQKINMSYLKKAMLLSIHDEKFVPSINKINVHSLKVLFHNRNSLEYLVSNEAAVLDAIRGAYPNELFSVLLYFNQPLNKQTSVFLNAIFAELGEKDQNIERLYLLGTIGHVMDRNLYQFFGCKKLTEKIVQSLKHRVYQFSLETHFEVIRLIISQAGYNPKDYYLKLVEWAEKNANENELENLLYKLAYTNYPARPEDLKHTKAMIKKTPFQGIFYFLVQEQLFEEKERKELVGDIVEVLGKGKPTEKLIQTFQYDYLKAAYPEQTKDLSLKPENLERYRFAPKPKPTVSLLLEQIAKAHSTTVGVLEMPTWGEENYIARIKDWVFIFYNPKRNGAYLEHEFIKRGLTQLYRQKGEELKPIYVGTTRGRPLLAYLQKQAPELITQDIEEKIKEYFDKMQPERDNEEGHQERKEKKQYREKRQPREPREERDPSEQRQDKRESRGYSKKGKEGYKRREQPRE